MNTDLLSSANLDELLTFLDTLADSSDLPSLVLTLRKRFPRLEPEILTIAAEISVTRRCAPEKLGEWSRKGFLSRALLQQASRTAIANYRADAFKGLAHVVEVGTGTGSDTAALASVCEHVTTIEVDPLTSELARRNLELRGVSNVTFLVGSAEECLPRVADSADGFFADPARRSRDGTRVKDASEYSPPLDTIMDLSFGRVRAIKISPGLFIDAPARGWSRQFLGYGAECLEQTLWFGTVTIDSSVFLADAQRGWSPAALPEPLPYADAISGWIVEAHAVLNRCQHLAQFFAERGIQQVAHDVAYGVSLNAPKPEPFLESFRILDAFPYNLRKLREAVKLKKWSRRTELKKRNCSLDLEEIRDNLPLEDHAHDAPFGVLFFFRWHNVTWVVLAERFHD